MSGGVDSSVVAALLKEQGYEVIGVTLQLYDHGAAVHRKGSCCAGQDIHDARLTAARLGIPHYVLDYEERFKRKVISPFAQSYAAGKHRYRASPAIAKSNSPICLETAQDLGADALATGHYVSSRLEATAQSRALPSPRPFPRSELFPVRDDQGATPIVAVSSRRYGKDASPRPRPPVRPAGCR